MGPHPVTATVSMNRSSSKDLLDIVGRSQERIEIARQNGKYKGREPKVIDEEKFAEVYRRWKPGEIKGVDVM